VARAAQQGYRAIAITDECSFAGLAKAHVAAKTHDIQLIVGSEFQLEEGIKLVLLAPTRAAYGQLAALITRLRRQSPKGQYQATLEDFRFGLADCLTLWPPGSACLPNAVRTNDKPLDHATARATRVDIDTLMAQGHAIREVLRAESRGNLWLALELFRDGTDLHQTAVALTLATRLELPIVASNDVHLHMPERQALQDVLTAVRLKCAVRELGTAGFGNAERHLRPLDDLRRLYPPEMLAESLAIAGRCNFSLDELRYEYPEELVPPGRTATDWLRELTWAGAAERWPQGVPADVRQLIERELVLIRELAYEYYFLTVHDIVQFARSQKILCQGRGSAANSAVCYCLFITEVDPSRMHLLFERFISKERHEPPDIDVDFEHERREEVIQYLYKRYGRDRAALAATLITYRPKSAIRDVGKALGLDLDQVDLMARSLSWWDRKEVLAERLRGLGVDPEGTRIRQLLSLVNEILGFPRHLSQHVGGFVISRGPLSQLVPVENAAMAERTVIQWDKDDLESLGLLKVDVLALGMLTAIRKCLDTVNAWRGTALTVSAIPAEDPATYRMLQRGDSIGVFQVESRAQIAMLPRLRPRHFYDLVIEVAIVRPGPIQGDMVHPYLRRRQGLEPVDYSSDGVRRVLERTLGIPIFQEQVIELAMVAAGFTAGEADQLRRAMAAWKRRGGLGHFEEKLINGMLARGHDHDFAQRVFKQIQGFGEYGFPESHAASFALLVYVSAWLKRHEPAAFYAGLLNSLPMGFYSPSQLVQDARRHDIEVRGVDVTASHWDHTLETPAAPAARSRFHTRPQPALRLGLRRIKGLGEAVAARLVAARGQMPFRDAADLARRAALSRQELEFLARAGALATLTGHRYQAHWDVAGIESPTALQAVAEAATAYHTDVALPAPGEAGEVIHDYQYLGLSLRRHPLSMLRDHPALARSCRAADLPNFRHGQLVQISGLVTGRQRPGTASGVLFVTLEDETGNSNIVVWRSLLERFRTALLSAQLLTIKGTVEREGEVIHVVAGFIIDHSHLLDDLVAADAAAGEASTQRTETAGDGTGSVRDSRSPVTAGDVFRSRDFR
ncbi:MAG: error-prone DNA polymerase, partial [Pseudomonadales bacterium]